MLRKKVRKTFHKHFFLRLFLLTVFAQLFLDSFREKLSLAFSTLQERRFTLVGVWSPASSVSEGDFFHDLLWSSNIAGKLVDNIQVFPSKQESYRPLYTQMEM